MKHVPVMLTEVLEALALHPRQVCVDVTIGNGGHAAGIVPQIAGGVYLGIDADKDALEEAQKTLSNTKDVQTHFVEQNFRHISDILAELRITKVDRVIADLGWGSHQLTAKRGFSFKEESPLNMCYSQNEDGCSFTAKDIVNSWDEEHIVDILYSYGEERWAKRIVKHILQHRSEKSIETSTELAEIIANAIPKRFQSRRIHPATKTFQALRIAVNDEIRALQEFLDNIQPLLAPEGRIAIISFHSIEDRIVKRCFRSWEREGKGTLLTKRPMRPSAEETEANPRARSAKIARFY